MRPKRQYRHMTPDKAREIRRAYFAREIIDANPGATLTEVVALAYLEGRIEGVNEVRKIAHDVFDNSATCQRCGRKVRLASAAPASMADRYVCFDCSAGDEPPRAA